MCGRSVSLKKHLVSGYGGDFVKDTQRNQVFPFQGSTKSSAKSGVSVKGSCVTKYVYWESLCGLLWPPLGFLGETEMQGLALKHLSQYQGTFLQSLGDIQLCCPSPISAGPPSHQGFLTGLYHCPGKTSKLHHYSLDMPHSSYPDSYWKLNPSLLGCFFSLNNQGTCASQQVQHSQWDRQKWEVCLFPPSLHFQSPAFSFLSYSHTCTLLEQLWSCGRCRRDKMEEEFGRSWTGEKK